MRDPRRGVSTAPAARASEHPAARSDLLAYPALRSFDLDLPTECDDEYWSHPDPEQAFKQPPGTPSSIAFFNCYIRLHQILAFALRTIVSTRRLRVAGRAVAES